MKYSGFVPLMSVLLFSICTNLYAADVEEEFRMCAAAAMESRLEGNAVFQVDLSELQPSDFTDTSVSSATKLDLTLTEKKTGKELGDVLCVLDSDGRVLSSEFRKVYGDFASQ